MQNQPRRHHYVPQFYLAAFTKSGTKDGHIYVLDKQLRKQWGPVTPNYIAHEPDFYRIDARPGADPTAIEKALSDIEAQCSRVVHNVIEQRQLPTGTDLEILLNFVALMAVRVPTVRSTISVGIDNVIKSIARTMLSSDEGWRRFARAFGDDSEGRAPSYQTMKAFVDSDEYTVDMDRSWHIGMMLELGSTLIPILAQRNWSIWIAEHNAPDLICSDRPVCLTWYTSPLGPLPPAFALLGTAVIMPVNRRIAISGTFEDQPPHSVLDGHDVATVNRSVLEYARQTYSSEADFVWATTEEQVENATGLLDILNKCVVDDGSTS